MYYFLRMRIVNYRQFYLKIPQTHQFHLCYNISNQRLTKYDELYHIQHTLLIMMLSADEIDMNHIALPNLYTLHN